MTKFNYGPSVAAARRLIKRFGSAVTITTPNHVANAQPWKPGVSVRPTTVTDAVFLRYEEKNIDGSTIRQGDQKVIFASTSFPYLPNVTGTIKRGAEIWNIVKITPLNPGGTVIIYTAQVRA